MADGTGTGSGPMTDPSLQPGSTTGTNPATGFASRYNPSQLASIIWETPWAILPDVFGGMKTQGPGYQALRDFGADPLTLYNLMAGYNNDLSGSEGGNAPGNYANWLAGMYQSMGTKGGRGFSGYELLKQLFNPQANSALSNILNAGDGATQMRTLFNMAREASNVGLNPLAARGYQASLARAGDTALNQMMNQNSGQGANNMSVYQLLRQNNPGLVPG